MSDKIIEIVQGILNTTSQQTKQPRPKQYKYSANDSAFELEKVWGMVSDKPLTTVIKDSVYLVELLPEEHKVIKEIFRIISDELEDYLNANLTTFEKHVQLKAMYFSDCPCTESIDEIIRRKKASSNYKNSIRNNLIKGLKMKPSDVIRELVDYLENIVSWNREQLEIYISALYEDLKEFAYKWHMGTHIVGWLSIRTSDVDSLPEINYSAYDVEKYLQNIIDKKYHASDSVFGKIHFNSLKKTNITGEFTCPNYDKWYKLGSNDKDRKQRDELNRQTFPKYNGQSFEGYAYKPFELISLAAINDYHHSAFDAISHAIKNHLMGYIAVHNTHNFCTYMDNVVELIRSGEKISTDDVVKYFDRK